MNEHILVRYPCTELVSTVVPTFSYTTIILVLFSFFIALASRLMYAIVSETNENLAW